MKRKFNDIFIVLLAATLILGVFAFAGCSGKQTANEPAKADFTGAGTEEDPWIFGELNAFVIDGTQLWFDGAGEIPDFDDVADRPWNDVTADLEQVNIFGEITRIGKNAFKGAGINKDTFDVFFEQTVEVFAESSFEGANFNTSCILTFPETVKEIGARAFADSALTCIYYDGAPEKIADDAFSGITASVNTRNGLWADENKVGYGGELTYKLLYAFVENDICDDGEASGSGTTYYPEGEEVTVDGDVFDGYKFERWELVEGDLDIADPENSLLTFTPTGDISVNIYYTAAETTEEDGEMIFEETLDGAAE